MWRHRTFRARKHYGITMGSTMEIPKLKTFSYTAAEIGTIAIIKDLINTDIYIDIFAPFEKNYLIYFLCTN